MTPEFVLRQGRRYLRMDQFGDPRETRAMKVLGRRNNRDPQQLARRWARQVARKACQEVRWTLAAYTAGNRARLGRLLSLEGIRRHQVGDSEVRVLFAPERLLAVAAAIQARRLRQITPELRANLLARLPEAGTSRGVEAPSDPSGGSTQGHA